MDLNPRTQRRVDRIHEDVDILVLLENFGFRVRGDMDRQQQFSCHWHGSGQDIKPSARAYPESNSWYCWGCQKTRDAISTVREANNLGFVDAIKWLEAKLDLPPLPFLDGDQYVRKETVSEEIAKALKNDGTFEKDAEVLSNILDMVTEDRALPMLRVMAYWDAYDRIVWMVTGKGQSLPEYQGRVALEKIRQRVMAEFQND